jgi:hypothetical protein
MGALRAPWTTPLLAAAALAAVAAPARAEGQKSAIAESLFADAKRLLEAGKVAQACPKFAESLRVEPTLGTRLNLARCYEIQGKTASAWAQYKEVLRLAGGDKKREAIAKERVGALDQALSHVTLAGAADAGLVIKLDGQALDAAVIGTSFAVDPGEHTLELSAPGKKPRTMGFHVALQQSTTVDLPALEGPDQTPPPTPKTAPEAAPEEKPHVEVSSGKRIGGIVTMSAGGAALVTGAIFGAVTIALADDVRAACPDPTCNDQTALDKNATAHTLAILSDVLIPVGAVAVGLGAYFFFTSTHRANPAAASLAVTVAPAVGPNGAGLSLEGRF